LRRQELESEAEAESHPERQRPYGSSNALSTRTVLAEVTRELVVLNEAMPRGGTVTEGTIEIYAKKLAKIPTDLRRRALDRLIVRRVFFPALSEIIREAAISSLALPEENDILDAAHRGIRSGDWLKLHAIGRKALRAVGGEQYAEGLMRSEMNTWRAQFRNALKAETEATIDREVLRMSGTSE
jgi:hypothetical protein